MPLAASPPGGLCEPAGVSADAVEPRPRHSVGALFEAALRRFGARLGAYLALTVVALVPTIVVFALLRDVDLGGFLDFGLAGFAYSLGIFGLCGVLTALVTDDLRGRIGVIAAAVGIASVASGVLSGLFPPLAIVAFPVLAFIPIAVAAGDVSPVRAIGHALGLAGRNLGSVYLVLVAIVIWAAANFFGFGIAFSPIGREAQRPLAVVAMTLLTWPVAALVLRNLYGDLTGRLVIRDADVKAREKALKRVGRKPEAPR